MIPAPDILSKILKVIQSSPLNNRRLFIDQVGRCPKVELPSKFDFGEFFKPNQFLSGKIFCSRFQRNEAMLFKQIQYYSVLSGLIYYRCQIIESKSVTIPPPPNTPPHPENVQSS